MKENKSLICKENDKIQNIETESSDARYISCQNPLIYIMSNLSTQDFPYSLTAENSRAVSYKSMSQVNLEFWKPY